MERLPCTRVMSSRYHVESCSFSPKGDFLAIGFGDYSVRLLRISEQNTADHAHSSNIHVDQEWVIRDHRNSVWCVRFSPDGHFLCTCSSDNTAKVWEVMPHTLKRSFEAHSDSVWSCSFHPGFTSPESQVIATGSSDKTVKIWNAESGEVLCDLEGYGDAVDSVDFSSNGELMCTSSRDGVVKIWMKLSIAKRSTTSLGKKSELSIPEPPVCIALTAVNRSASRFCVFSCTFSSSLMSYEHNESAQVTEDALAYTLYPHNGDFLSKIDPNELLFAGGPDNSISVWRVGDIVAAYEKVVMLNPNEGKLNKAESEHSLCLSEEEHVESKTGHNIMVTCNEEGTSGEHNTRCQESNSIRRNISRIKQSPDKSKNERFGTRLEAIIEEHTGELVQSEHRELISNDCKEESNYESTTSAASLASDTGSEEASYLSEEMFSFYKVQPRWVMTDHRNTVWDCCTALLHNSEHIISERHSGNESTDFNMSKGLPAIDPDNSDPEGEVWCMLYLKFWRFENDDTLSPPALRCVKVFQMPGEHSESQILSCAYCPTNQLLAIGLFNGSVHLADLSDLCLSIHNT